MSNASQVSGLWADLASFTVDKLKAVIRKVNESPHFRPQLRQSGLKSELLERIKAEVNRLAADESTATKYQIIRKAIIEVRDQSSPARWPQTESRAQYMSTGYQPYGYTNFQAQNAPPAGALYTQPEPMPAPRFEGNQLGTGLPANARNWNPVNRLGGVNGAARPTPSSQNVKFRPSPFYTSPRQLGAVIITDKAAQNDRRTSSMMLTLSPADRKLLLDSKVSPANTQYQLRMYTTTDELYTRSVQANEPAPIEFPPTCEVKVNGYTMQGNMRGIKKVVGSAPPLNLMGTGLDINGSNRVEVVYANTDKKYYWFVHLVLVKTVKDLVNEVRGRPRIPSDEVIASIKKLNIDEDVIATNFVLSFQDPLTFARINLPIRSKNCKHIGCFDAETWYMMMEQTPTWACPICSKTLNHQDMVVDGYFEKILSICPAEIEQVTVEPDGTWISSDSHYGTSSAVVPPVSKVSAPELVKPKLDQLTLDSDSEDDDPPKMGGRKQLILGSSPQVPVAPPKRPAVVLDLTFSDDEDVEDDYQTPVAAGNKRKSDMMGAGPDPAAKRLRDI